MPIREPSPREDRNLTFVMFDDASACSFELGVALENLDPIERRVAPRHIPLEFRAWIGWWDGGDFVATAVRLLDISRAGVAVEAGELLPVKQDVWFCFAQGEDRESVAGRVAGSGRAVKGCHLARISFWEPCPEGVFRTAIHGMEEWGLSPARFGGN